LFSPPKLDLSNFGLEEFQRHEFEGYGPKTSKSVSEDISNVVKESSDPPLVKKLVSDDKLTAINIKWKEWYQRIIIQMCMMAIFHDMIEKMMEVFMDDFSVFGDSFSSCLSHLDKKLQRCEDTNLVLNWEKYHFMVKVGMSSATKFLSPRLRSTELKLMS
nr:reverse transcriptase domain-containing protein [Tanacetum cinerariifolium]